MIDRGQRQRNQPKLYFPQSSWGCLVSSGDDVAAARDLGASWVVASHAGKLPGGAPASVIGLMPYADANGQVLEMAAELVRAAGSMPVFAGILAIDQFREIDHFLHILSDAGFAGIQTFPSVGILAGSYLHLLEEVSLGREVELDAVGAASRMGLYAVGVAFASGQAKETVAAGADMVLVHLPLAESGGVEEWSVNNRKLYAEAVEEAGDASVAAFVPAAGSPLKRSVLGSAALLQFENAASAKAYLGLC